MLVVWYLDDSCTGWVIDLDSTLPFPCPIDEYIASALKPSYDVFRTHPHLQRRFRVVQATEVIANFSSDRSHMLVEGADGQQHYSSAPPTYPCISTSTCENNLQIYLDMSLTESSSSGNVCLGGPFGAVLSESLFIRLALSNKLVSQGL